MKVVLSGPIKGVSKSPALWVEDGITSTPAPPAPKRDPFKPGGVMAGQFDTTVQACPEGRMNTC